MSTTEIDSNYFVTRYLAIADTGQNYYTLDNLMYSLGTKLHWTIDTGNRYYNTAKNEIVLADNEEDEMYQGEYYPRRETSMYLSLEYYNWYNGEAATKNIALVSALYEQQREADSLVAILRPYAPHAFVLKGKVYMGCMH